MPDLLIRTETTRFQFYSPDEPRDERGRWTDGGGSGGDPTGEVKHGGTVDSAWKALHADRYTTEAQIREHPENYNPNGGFGVHLKIGGTEWRTGKNERHEPITWQVKGVDQATIPIEKRADYGLPFKDLDGRRVVEAKVPGSEQPSLVYRIMSTKEWDQAQKRGYFQSDQRANLMDEGTNASLRSTGSFYAYPEFGSARIVQFKADPAYGWKVEHDDYIKTHGRIPVSSVRAYTAPIPLTKKAHEMIRRLFYSPDEPRDDHGRWTDAGGVGATVAKGLNRQLRATGGFTYEPRSKSEPVTGYVVATHEKAEKIMPAASVKASDIRAYAKAHWAELQRDKNLHLGGWIDSGKVALDLSTVVQDRATAIKMGKQYKQEGVWDIGGKTTIYTRARTDNAFDKAAGEQARVFAWAGARYTRSGGTGDDRPPRSAWGQSREGLDPSGAVFRFAGSERHESGQRAAPGLAAASAGESIVFKFVDFYTDEDGIVHPIRDSTGYETGVGPGGHRRTPAGQGRLPGMTKGKLPGDKAAAVNVGLKGQGDATRNFAAANKLIAGVPAGRLANAKLRVVAWMNAKPGNGVPILADFKLVAAADIGAAAFNDPRARAAQRDLRVMGHDRAGQAAYDYAVAAENANGGLVLRGPQYVEGREAVDALVDMHFATIVRGPVAVPVAQAASPIGQSLARMAAASAGASPSVIGSGITNAIPAGQLSITKELKAGGHINKVYLGKVAGEDVVVKPATGAYGRQIHDAIPQGTDAERETAAYVVARALGVERVTPPVDIRMDPKLGKVSVQAFWKNQGDVSELGGLNRHVAGNMDRVKAIALIDGVIGNGDRHGSNMMIGTKGELIAIDHGLAFPEKRGVPTAHNAQVLDALVRHSAVNGNYQRVALEPSHLAALKALQADHATHARVQALVGLRAEKMMMGRVNWMVKNNVYPAPADLRQNFPTHLAALR